MNGTPVPQLMPSGHASAASQPIAQKGSGGNSWKKPLQTATQPAGGGTQSTAGSWHSAVQIQPEEPSLAEIGAQSRPGRHSSVVPVQAPYMGVVPMGSAVVESLLVAPAPSLASMPKVEVTPLASVLPSPLAPEDDSLESEGPTAGPQAMARSARATGAGVARGGEGARMRW